LAQVVAVACSAALYLDGPRIALHPVTYADSKHIVFVTTGGQYQSGKPSIDYEEYQVWQTHHSQLLTESAYYRADRILLRDTHQSSRSISIVETTQSFLHLVPMLTILGSLPTDSLTEKKVILSERLWRERFGEEAKVIGSKLRIGESDATVVAVASQDAWPLPGAYDAWVFSPQKLLSISPGTRGFAIARLAPAVFQHGDKDLWQMSYGDKTDWYSFDCTPLYAMAYTPLSVIAFALLMAVLSVPAATVVSLGEYPKHDRQPGLRTTSMRWFFLSAKFFFIVVGIGVATLDIAYFDRSISPASSEYIAFIIGFLSFLISLRWMLHDQRKRCPVCLCLLKHPVRVGHASHSLLAWGGTEWICSDGHGFLHVPHLATSWFSTQRWLYADASWQSCVEGDI